MPDARGFLLLAAGLGVFLTTSCGSLQSNARRSVERLPQANDPLTGGATLAMTAFRSTAVAAVRQPVTTATLGITLLWHRPREVIAGNIPVEITLGPAVEEIPGTPEFEALLDRSGFAPAEPGTVEWLVDGSAFFSELDRQIAGAREAIDFQIFIFDNDDTAVRYADALKRRAGEIPVRVLIDDLGSTFAATSAPETPGPPGFVPPANIARYLRSGSEVEVRRILNPWLTCDHTKLLVFDRRTALLGGMNIGREYRSEWHDLMMKVEGPIVAQLSRDFQRSWKKAGWWGDFALWGDPTQQARQRSVAGYGVPLRILRTDPAEGRHEILDATLLAIRAARERIWIQTPYFSHDDIALALQSAARRGVDVRVIIPSRGDSTIMDVGNLATARGLIQAGVRVYRYPKMTHMKIMLCDGWGNSGSANLDLLSMRINRELNLAFSDPASIRAVERRIFLPDFRASRQMTLGETSSPIAPLAETIADQL